MANSYYLVTSKQVETARACAVEVGLPHQLFGGRYNNDQTKAIVQAEWTTTPPGQCLGGYADGQAAQAVFDELAKMEWRDEG